VYEQITLCVICRVLLVLILVEIMHTVVLSLRAHHLVTQPLLAVGLAAPLALAAVLVPYRTRLPNTDAALALAAGGVVHGRRGGEAGASGSSPSSPARPSQPATRPAGRT
jgi:Phosphate-starvation-inducible E family